MKKVKFFSVLMSLLLICSVCVSCGGSQEEATESAEVTNESTETATATEEGLYSVATFDNFSIEYPKEWIAENHEQMIHVSKDGTTNVPFMFVERIGKLDSSSAFITDQMKTFEQKYQNQMAQPPMAQTKEIGNRNLDGFVAKYSAEDASGTITRYEFADIIDDITYHYVCEYYSSVSGDAVEDETTYFEFEHAMQSMTVK